MFELLFGHPWALYREAELSWASGYPTWAWLACIVLAALLVAASVRMRLQGRRGLSPLSASLGRRAWWIAALQVLVAAGVLTLLWRPALRVERLEPGRNAIALLIDVSRSMSFGEGDSSRLEQALERLREGAFSELEKRFAIETYTFGASLQRSPSWLELPAPQDTTRLVPALGSLARSARDAQFAAVILISDGCDKTAEPLPRFLAELSQIGVPVHTIGAGRERLPEDLELAEVDAPARALAGTRIPVELTIRHATRGAARVVVRRGDAVIAAHTATLRADSSEERVRIELEARDPGLLDLEIALDPLPDERILGNNRARALIDVRAEPRRMLYLEGEPRWEHKFLRRALRDDRSLELVSLLRTTRNKQYRQGIATPDELADGFPESKEALFPYAGLIIGSYEAAALAPEQHALIREFVSTRGGALLMLGGAQGLGAGGWGVSSLAEVLPAALVDGGAPLEEPSRALLTPHGAVSQWLELDADPERNRRLWRELPPVADLHPIGELKLGAAALIEASAGGRARPLLVMQRYGRGRSAILATSGTWRWHMLAEPGDTRHQRFWRQLLRYLADSAPDPIELEVADSETSGRARVVAHVRTPLHDPIEDATLRASLSSDGEAPVVLELAPTAEPGQFAAEASLRPSTLYRVDLELLGEAGARILRSVHHRSSAAPAEDFAPQQNRALLEQIASATGGRYWKLDALDELPKALQASPRSITREEVLEIWNVPGFFLALIALRALEWLLRRRWGAM